jgi:N-acetylmuramoyl-L-alanine amidase
MLRLLAFILALPALAPAAPGLKLVVLDPGHGGNNLGARYRLKPRRYEKQYTLIVAKQVKGHLEAAGVKVVLTRTEDVAMALRPRIYLANSLHADLFVSIHFNATHVPGPTGHETFFLALEASDETSKRLVTFENTEGGTVEHAAESVSAGGDVDKILLDLTQSQAHRDAQSLASAIQGRMIHASPFKNRGVKQAPFFVLMGAAMPAVVTEVGFINHRKEGPYITSEEGLRKISKAIADGILDFGKHVVAGRKAEQ